jgi:translation initiation factor IF-1
VANKERIIKIGKVIESLPNATFLVELEENKEKVICHLGGQIRLHRIKILPGDRVKIEISPYDKKRGRIIFRENP